MEHLPSETKVLPEMFERPAAVIYLHSLIEGSMTFVKSHAEALQAYCPVYAGAHRVNGIPLPEERTFVVNGGTPFGILRETVFRKCGWAPGLVKKLKLYNPQVVHAHFGTSGPSGLALANALGVPLVVTFHGYDATMRSAEVMKTYRGRELRKKKDRLIKEAGAFIAVSTYIRRQLIEQGYPSRKVLLHRNGIDLNFFHPRSESERKPIVLFVGRFVEKKGARYLIQAATELHESGVLFELVMIGKGPLQPELRRAAEEARIPCRFLGFLTLEEVRDWLGRASVVAIPSVTAKNGDSEGLPTTLLEAQAMETPVVATRHSGIPEGVLENVTAELVAERDASALAGRLRPFLESPTKVRQFGKAGRRFVSENFDLRKQVAGLEKIYGDVRELRSTEGSMISGTKHANSIPSGTAEQ